MLSYSVHDNTKENSSPELKNTPNWIVGLTEPRVELHALKSSIFFVPKVLIEPAHLKIVLLCFAMASNRILWLMRARARQSDSEL